MIAATKSDARKVRRKVSDAEKFADLRRRFPKVETPIEDVLEDDQFLGRLLVDICRVGWTPTQRRGNRAELDYATFVQRLRALADMRKGEYTGLPFADAFTILAGERSLAHVASKTGLSRSQVRRLLVGTHTPSTDEMEAVAKAFGKNPMFFTEYRTAAILAKMAEHLTSTPEVSVGLVAQMSLDKAFAQAS